MRVARGRAPGVPLEVEVENLVELAEALDSDADRIMLDDFTIEDIKRAVALRDRHTGKRKELEVSGGSFMGHLSLPESRRHGSSPNTSSRLAPDTR